MARSRLPLLIAATAHLAWVGGAAAQPGTPRPRPEQNQRQAALQCSVKENGAPASGTVVVREGDREVVRGTCGAVVRVPAGTYYADVRLDGALDRPQQTKIFTVRPGQTAEVQADFETGILEVMVEADGRRAAGMAVILRHGQRVGTLGSGVAAHLSAGTYHVVVRHRSQEKRYEDVKLAAGQHRRLRAEF